MPTPTTAEQLRGLILSAVELKSMTNWPGALIEDYLNLFNNLVLLADKVDIEIDQKIEEIDTDFTDGSIPFANNNKLAEDNAHLFWDLVNNILKITGRIQSAGRLKGGTIVTNAMSPYTILPTDETVNGDTDTGIITMLLPAGVDDTAYRIVNTGTSGNDITLTPNGTELLYGLNASEPIHDLEHLDMQYSIKGWG